MNTNTARLDNPETTGQHQRGERHDQLIQQEVDQSCRHAAGGGKYRDTSRAFGWKTQYLGEIEIQSYQSPILIGTYAKNVSISGATQILDQHCGNLVSGST